MPSYFSLPVSIFLIIFSYRCFRHSFGTVSIDRYLPHTHLLFYQIIASCIIGIEAYNYGFRTSILTDFGITNDSITLSLFVVWYIVLSFSLSIFFLFKGKNQEKALLSFINSKFLVDRTKGYQIFFCLMTVVSIAVVLYLYYVGAPIFGFFQGNLSSILSSRVSYTREFEGSYLIKNVLGQNITVLVSYVCFLEYIIRRDNVWKTLFFANFVCAVLISGASLSKSGLVSYLIPFLYIYSALGGKIKVYKWALFIVACLVILMLSYNIQRNNDLFSSNVLFDIQNGPISRIFLIQIQSLPAFFMVFPDMVPFTYGTGIAVLRFLGLEHQESARIVASYLEPVGVQSGWVGVANTLFVGDAYANFGWLGVLISPIIVAIWFYFFYRRFLKKRKSPLLTCSYIVILNNLVNSFTGGFCSAYIINTYVIAVLIFYGFAKVFVSLLNGNTKLTLKKSEFL